MAEASKTRTGTRIAFTTFYGRQERGLMLYGNQSHGLVRDGDGNFVAVEWSAYSQKWKALEISQPDEAKALEVLGGRI